MAYNDGIPIASNPAAPGTLGSEAHPFDWINPYQNEQMGVSPMAAMRGHPVALDWWQQRPRGPQTLAFAGPMWLQSRPYDRGAGAYSPKFGQISYNPIGGGIYSPYKLPVIAGPGARYMAAAIWFDVQAIPTSLNIGPGMSMESLNALIATSSVGPSYLTTG